MVFVNSPAGPLAVGDCVTLMYPARGTSNVTRRVTGEIVRVGHGPNGQFITVKDDLGSYRSLSMFKASQVRITKMVATV